MLEPLQKDFRNNDVAKTSKAKQQSTGLAKQGRVGGNKDITKINVLPARV